MHSVNVQTQANPSPSDSNGLGFALFCANVGFQLFFSLHSKACTVSWGSHKPKNPYVHGKLIIRFFIGAGSSSYNYLGAGGIIELIIFD